jgi:hypothetical protein
MEEVWVGNVRSLLKIEPCKQASPYFKGSHANKVHGPLPPTLTEHAVTMNIINPQSPVLETTTHLLLDTRYSRNNNNNP